MKCQKGEERGSRTSNKYHLKKLHVPFVKHASLNMIGSQVLRGMQLSLIVLTSSSALTVRLSKFFLLPKKLQHILLKLGINPYALRRFLSNKKSLYQVAGVQLSSKHKVPDNLYKLMEDTGEEQTYEYITQLMSLQKKFTELKSQLELKSYDLSLFQSRAEQTEHRKMGEMVKKLEQDLAEAKQEQDDKQQLHADCVSKVKLHEKNVKEHANNREDRLEDLDKKMKTTRAQMQLASKDLKGYENERERLIMEKEAVIQEQALLETQMTYLETQIYSLKAEVDEHKIKVNILKNVHDDAESELKLFCAKINDCDSEINSFYKDEQNLQHQISELALERKKLEIEVKRIEMEQKDFFTTNPCKAKDKLEKLQAEKSDLEKCVNKKLMAKFEQGRQVQRPHILKEYH